MASCQTTRWVSTAPYVKLTVTQDADTDETSYVVAWKLEYISSSAADTDVAKSYTVTINGVNVKTGTYSINGKSGTYTIASGAQLINKTTSSQKITFKVSFAFNLTWSGVYGGTKTASGTFTVPAITSYSVSYNANGGTGAPSSQVKWHGTTLKLSTTKPTRTGHTFKGWSTTKKTAVDGSATYEYSPGSNYTANKTAVMFAVWNAQTYTVTYNANGGTGAPSSQTKLYGVNLTLSSAKPSRSRYVFKGWGTSSTATTPTYNPGSTYTSNAGITLYAIWELDYTKPRISGLSADRCESDGTTSDTGTYACVKFDYACDEPVSSIKIEWITASGDTESATVSTSGVSGSISQVIGEGSLDTEKTYTIRVIVTDLYGSTSKTLTLSGMKFAIDFLAGGKGVAFGKPAETQNYVDFGFDALFDNNLAIAGRDLSGNIKEAFQPQNQNGNTIVGWGNYDNGNGDTHVYGYDIRIGVGNTANPGLYKPYINRGDSFSVTVRTAGYVTNSGKDVSFFVPLTRPIVGDTVISASSGAGFILRQNGEYTHGSAADTHTTPSSYSVSGMYTQGVMITATFSTTTNVTNNDSIGIYWNGILTFT